MGYHMSSVCRLAALILLFSSQIICAQNESFKAVFIYNFTKYIGWPAESQSSEFVITVFGDGRIISELEMVAAQHRVDSKPIIIKKAETISAISATQILFVTKEKTNQLAQIIELCASKHILLITEKANSCTIGAAINFVSKNGNLSFEIHRGNLEKSGLKANSQLLHLGSTVQ